MIRRLKVPTATSLVLEALVRADDFLTAKQLVLCTGQSYNHVAAALHHLRSHKAVETVDGQDALWWFATPATDDRKDKRAEITPESKPRKPRKTRRKP